MQVIEPKRQVGLNTLFNKSTPVCSFFLVSFLSLKSHQQATVATWPKKETSEPVFQDLVVFSHTFIMQETLSELVIRQGARGILEPRVTQHWSGPPCAHSLLGRQWERRRSSLCQFVSSKTLGSSPKPDHPTPSMGALFFLLLRPEPSHRDSFPSLRCCMHSHSKSSQVPTTITTSTTTTRLKGQHIPTGSPKSPLTGLPASALVSLHSLLSPIARMILLKS